MLIQCPTCKARLRFNQPVLKSRLVTLCCPRCSAKLKLQIKGTSLKVLIAHEDQVICQQLLARLEKLPVTTNICSEPQEVIQQLSERSPCLLLLDVAFAGRFPFEMIEQVRQQSGGVEHRVVLLASVYNKTAYKRKPTSLYGADAYLELHHIGDRLLPILAEFFPELRAEIAVCEEASTLGGERILQQADLYAQALALSRLLIADIALYHQDRLLLSVQQAEAQQVLADCLKEGRRLLLQRLPEAAALSDDCLQLAFDEFYQSYASYRLRSCE